MGEIKLGMELGCSGAWSYGKNLGGERGSPVGTWGRVAQTEGTVGIHKGQQKSSGVGNEAKMVGDWQERL